MGSLQQGNCVAFEGRNGTFWSISSRYRLWWRMMYHVRRWVERFVFSIVSSIVSLFLPARPSTPRHIQDVTNGK